MLHDILYIDQFKDQLPIWKINIWSVDINNLDTKSELDDDPANLRLDFLCPVGIDPVLIVAVVSVQGRGHWGRRSLCGTTNY